MKQTATGPPCQMTGLGKKMGKSPLKRWQVPLPNAQPNYHFSHVSTAGELKVGRQSKFTEEDKEGHQRVILKVILLG